MTFHWYIYIWSWPFLNVKVKVVHILTVNISQMMADVQTLPSPIHRQSPIGVQMIYLQLNLAHSKDQGQHDSQFGCKKMANWVIISPYISVWAALFCPRYYKSSNDKHYLVLLSNIKIKKTYLYITPFIIRACLLTCKLYKHAT